MKQLVRAAACLVVAVSAFALMPSTGLAAVELPSGFQESVVLSEVAEPTTMRFSPDGRIFVAEKTGRILVFDELEDESPEVFADLRTEVYDNGDRGLLGLALDPDFSTNHFVYALYTYDHILGGEGEEGKVPRWGEPDHSGDDCPKPPGSGVDACPVSGRLVRLTANGNHAQPTATAPSEKVLLEDWCQQFSSHSIGDLQFGPEGALYVSGGDGASFNNADYGQFGWPHKNQCGDPPGEIGEELTPPTAEGGALRSQDLRTPGDPLGLGGTVVRIDPSSGAGLPGNPMFSALEPSSNASRIVAYGFRNPFRFTVDPASGEIYVGNVGWDTYEEIDRVPPVGGEPVFNSGWPCFEGPGPNPVYAGLELNLCKSLYAEAETVTPPLFFYKHYENVIPEEECASGTGSALSGLAFYPGGAYPDAYDGALFFADPVRSCIWVMYPGDDGRPDPLTTATFMANGGLYPGVDLQVGPEGDLYYVKLFGNTEEGTIHRISYDPDAPVARLTVDKQWGPKPLEVQLDASGSTDPGEKPLSFEWDLEGNGNFESGDSEEEATYNVNHNVAVGVRVSNGIGSSVARVTLYPDDSPPVPQIETPAGALEWAVGQQIDFTGSASDVDEGGALPATALYWKTRLYHCPAACHAHPLQVFPGVAGGSFIAPDHDYPSHIEINLTATDARGLTATKAISIDAHPAKLEVKSEPPGVQLGAGELTQVAPFELTAIDGANIVLSAPASVEIEGATLFWQEWSDGGARVHTVQAGAAPIYTAVYGEEPPKEEGGEEPGAENPPAEQPAPVQLSPGPSLPRPSLPLPVTQLEGHPARQTHQSVASFSFTANATGAGFRCRLDRGAFAPCRSPRVFKHLRPGWHRFLVDAVDARGVADPTPASYRWRVLCAALRRATQPRRGCAN